MVSALSITVPETALSPRAARVLTDEVKADAAALWAKLLGLYEGGAHVALGYASWSDYCAAEFDMGKSHAYRMLDAGRVVGVLEVQSPSGETAEPARWRGVGQGIASVSGMPPNEGQARELVPLLDDEAELVATWRELRAKHGEKLTAEKVRWAVGERLRLEQRIGTVTSSANAECYTPARYVDAAREVLGGIDLDPASCAEANETVRARRFYDARTDGLTQPWEGRVWCNPPYGREGPKFVAKALQEFETGSVPAAVLLLSGYSVDTAWFAPLWDHVLCFVLGRIRFRGPLLGDEGTPTAASVFVYLGPDWPRFASVFGELGPIVARWTPGERHVPRPQERGAA